MNYITNHNDQIIAADESLLYSLNVQNIDDLIKKVLLEEISFRKQSSTELQIVTSTETYTYSMHLANLESMLGSLNLVHLEVTKETTDDASSFITPNTLGQGSLVADIIHEDEEEVNSEQETLSIVEPEDTTLAMHTIDDDMVIKDELFELDTKESDDTSNTLTEKEKLFDLSLPNETISNDSIGLSNTVDTPKIDDSELFDLSLPVTPLNKIDDISLDSDEDTEESSIPNESLDTSPIIININEVSEEIGISNEDYKTFLNNYIDTAISLEDELQSEDENERLSAMGTLTQLADVLQLPKVNAIIQQVPIVAKDELPHLIESFYQTLARLTTKETSEENVDAIAETSSEPLLDLHETEAKPLQDEISHVSAKGGFGKIYLEDVKPIHFDFQLESAANDLSLPVELIEEFVHDFIEQGHIETKKMLQAYEEGDLDTIQKIGHLLKGASSNLRINALSDTLYDIQFCENSDTLEDLIENYWAHFISFEQQIDMITKQGQ